MHEVVAFKRLVFKIFNPHAQCGTARFGGKSQWRDAMADRFAP